MTGLEIAILVCVAVDMIETVRARLLAKEELRTIRELLQVPVRESTQGDRPMKPSREFVTDYAERMIREGNGGADPTAQDFVDLIVARDAEWAAAAQREAGKLEFRSEAEKVILRPRLDALADELCQTQPYIIGALYRAGLTVVPLALPRETAPGACTCPFPRTTCPDCGRMDCLACYAAMAPDERGTGEEG